ncbi:phage tail protein [Agathobacter sp. LCP21S3_B2]|uniref:phage tail protein n=1 Tax=Agathobacter sp. LCP21S3_B2 TaxID=3438734 RepID=UPI003F91ACD6
MQIFNDKKKRIGTLSGFKDREITTTLDSGDKELAFSYPTAGALVDLLKEEYYIRTKTDEFVLKAVEKGEQFNKYTAVLNVEELEGTPFPYGFESNEQTIKACLEFAFEGTGWHVGTCTVTKKRTIDEQESVTAWDVLQKCLTTYRCECIIHSLTKTIDIYDRIGSDKGCYFMEGLNLRKISLKSDTYDFYTRIYPIGKDGITPKWLTGKDYIDNFQYSSKIKAYVWKDERYTNTTSLIEDATAKIEEMSRPYKAYTAEVVDLANASEEYKDILSYGIGDTVTLVSKKTRTKEKQRIVKIREYPETPKKNTVEISNARKTFAEIQKEETAAATEEAISIANNNTKKVLRDGYYTKTDVESHITAAKDEISLGVSQVYETKKTVSEKVAAAEKNANAATDEKLTEYSTTEQMQSAIDMKADEINLGVSKTYETKTSVSEKITAANKTAQDAANAAEKNANAATDEKLTEYSTTEQMQSAIDMKADEINLGVSKTYETKQTVSEKVAAAEKNANDATDEKLTEYSTTEQMQSAIDMKADEINLGVSKTYETKTSVSEKITAANKTAQDAANAAEKNANAATDEKLTEYSTTEQMQSAIDMKADEINLGVSKTYETKQTVSEKVAAAEKNANDATDEKLTEYSTTVQMNAAIKLKTDEITSEVNKKVNEDDFGTLITQNAYNVRVAFNKGSSYMQFDSTGITMYTGTITDNTKRTRFDYNGEHFYRDGNYVGKIGTNTMKDNDSQRGLVFDIEYNTAYMSWSNKESQNTDVYTMKWSYCTQQCGNYEANMLHAGADINMHFFKLRNVSFEDGSISGTLTFKQPLEVGSDGKLAKWSTATLEFKRGILVSGTWSDG